MKRVIKDHASITEEQIKLIVDRYPKGFDGEELMLFTNAKGKSVKALEIKTDDTIYLFKMSSDMVIKLADHTDDDFDLGDLLDFIKENR